MPIEYKDPISGASIYVPTGEEKILLDRQKELLLNGGITEEQKQDIKIAKDTSKVNENNIGTLSNLHTKTKLSLTNATNEIFDKQTMDIKQLQQTIRNDNQAKISKFLLPPKFIWKDIPMQIFTDGKSYKTFFDVSIFKNKGGITYYIKSDTGLDTNNGTSESTPFKSMNKALNIATDGDTIVILDTLLSRSNLSISSISITKSINIIAKTKCVIKAGDTHTFTKTAGRTSIWETTRTNSLRVIDYEKEYEFLKLDSILECDSTPGSWYTDGTKVYIHTLESSTPIDSNHFILINTSTFVTVDSTTRDVKFYLENVDIVGGVPTLETKNSSSTKSYVYIKNSRLMYNCSTLQGAFYAAGCEHAFSQNVTTAYSWEDGFDYQPLNGTPTKFIELYCKGHSNGRLNQSADNFNGSTAHQDCKGLRFGGQYYRNIGPQVVDIYGTVQSININCVVFDGASTQIITIGFEVMDNDMWLYNCTSFGNDVDIYFPTGSMYLDRNTTYFSIGGSGNLVID